MKTPRGLTLTTKSAVGLSFLKVLLALFNHQLPSRLCIEMMQKDVSFIHMKNGAKPVRSNRELHASPSSSTLSRPPSDAWRRCANAHTLSDTFSVWRFFSSFSSPSHYHHKTTPSLLSFFHLFSSPQALRPSSLNTPPVSVRPLLTQLTLPSVEGLHYYRLY